MRIVHVTTRFFFLCGYGLYNDKFVRTILQQCQDLVDNDNFAVSDACEDGLGYVNGQPYPTKWPKHRNFHDINQCQKQSLQDAFNWPAIVRDAMREHLLSLGSSAQPLAADCNRCLTVSSHWSGVCTQSRGSQILAANDVVGCRFKHAPPSASEPYS